MMRRLAHEESGFSLVELLVVCAVLVIVMGATSNLLVSGLRVSDRGQAQLASQGAARTALDRLELEARCAASATILSSGAGVYLDLPTQCPHATGDVSWCVSSGSLVRLTGSSCTGTTETLITGVTSTTPFCEQTVTGDLPQLYVSLAISDGTNANDATTATDVITLRNAAAATSTSTACP